MAYQPVDIGAAPNDGTGDPIRDAFDKINDNFVELYGSLAGLLDFQGATDCSANPNYPAASQGDIYIVSVAGKIGGASGKVVEVGDFYLALADNGGGTEASVGTSWAVLQANITGGSVISELDDVPDVNAPSPSNGDVLTWDSTPGEWIPAAPSGGASALDDLTDVDAPTPSDGDVLTFDSGSGDWVPAAPTGGGGLEKVSDSGYDEQELNSDNQYVPKHGSVPSTSASSSNNLKVSFTCADSQTVHLSFTAIFVRNGAGRERFGIYNTSGTKIWPLAAETEPARKMVYSYAAGEDNGHVVSFTADISVAAGTHNWVVKAEHALSSDYPIYFDRCLNVFYQP